MKENNRFGRRYDREFKDNAVALARAGRTVAGVARDLGVATWSLGRWGERPRRQGDRVLVSKMKPLLAASRQTYGSLRITRRRCARVGCGAARTGWRGSCASRACVPGTEAGALATAHHRGATIARPSPRTGWPGCPLQIGPIKRGWPTWPTSIQARAGCVWPVCSMRACSRRRAGWQTGDPLEATLATQAWQKACRDRRPRPGLLHHSDRGVQYASGAMAALLKQKGAAASMSRKGNGEDNAMMESFWATLKAECFPDERPPTRRAAQLKIFDCIAGFYNRSRLHSSLGYQSPLAFERTIPYINN